MSSSRENKEESKLISTHLANDESTMNTVTAQGVGMLVSQLETVYFKDFDAKQIQKECHECLDEVKEFAARRSHKDQESVKNIISCTEEKVNALDNVTVYLHSESGQSTTKVLTLPLLKVLTLVWKALNDDTQFAAVAEEKKNSGKEEKKSESKEERVQFKTDREHRIDSFFTRLGELHKKPVCHMGTRHELVFLLNKIYKDVELIENTPIMVCAFLKESISELFKAEYKSDSISGERKKILQAALMKWVISDDASVLFSELDSKKRILGALKAKFIKNGSDPASVDKLYQDALASLECTITDSDHHEDQTISRIANLFHSSEIDDQHVRAKALLKMQQWMKTRFVLSDSDHRRIVNAFYEIYQSHYYLDSFHYLLKVVGKFEPFKKVSDSLALYFKGFVEDDRITLAPIELCVQFRAIESAVDQVKKDNLYDFVKNFFSNWYAHSENSEEERKFLEDRKHLYSILIDAKCTPKLTASDAFISATIKSNMELESKELFIGPYEINRIFLHAILVSPYKWTDLFKKALELVFSFVKNTFDNPGSGIAKAIKKSSFPAKFIWQINYLINKSKDVSDSDNPRPAGMIVLPEQVETAAELNCLSLWLNQKDYYEGYYKTYANQYNQRILKELTRLSEYKDEYDSMITCFHHWLTATPHFAVSQVLNKIDSALFKKIFHGADALYDACYSFDYARLKLVFDRLHLSELKKCIFYMVQKYQMNASVLMFLIQLEYYLKNCRKINIRSIFDESLAGNLDGSASYVTSENLYIAMENYPFYRRNVDYGNSECGTQTRFFNSKQLCIIVRNVQGLLAMLDDCFSSDQQIDLFETLGRHGCQSLIDKNHLNLVFNDCFSKTRAYLIEVLGPVWFLERFSLSELSPYFEDLDLRAREEIYYQWVDEYDDSTNKSIINKYNLTAFDIKKMMGLPLVAVSNEVMAGSESDSELESEAEAKPESENSDVSEEKKGASSVTHQSGAGVGSSDQAGELSHAPVMMDLAADDVSAGESKSQPAETAESQSASASGAGSGSGSAHVSQSLLSSSRKRPVPEGGDQQGAKRARLH